MTQSNTDFTSITGINLFFHVIDPRNTISLEHNSSAVLPLDSRSELYMGRYAMYIGVAFSAIALVGVIFCKTAIAYKIFMSLGILSAVWTIVWLTNLYIYSCEMAERINAFPQVLLRVATTANRLGQMLLGQRPVSLLG